MDRTLYGKEVKTMKVNYRNNSHKNILIVDDDHISSAALANYLYHVGFNVEFAKDGIEALIKLKLNPRRYSVVLLDIIMPRLDGLKVLDLFKSSSVLCNIPVIMLTKVDEMKNIIHAVNIGAFEYLIKPVEIESLLKLVNRALETVNEEECV